jgi:S-adenosylmethionine-dependent methyltransferase
MTSAHDPDLWDETRPYEIQSQLGAGGIGEVYRARNTGLGCNVATKVPSDTLARDTDRLRRFEQEARTTATLNHSDILAIHEIGTPDRRDFWLASFWKVRRRARNWDRGPFDVRSGCYERLDWGTSSLEGHMKMTAKADSERFQSGANQYAVYLETPEGRLRSDLAFANLQDFLPRKPPPSLCALDLGCGTGATAVRLARLGMHVTLLDSSPAMLDIAKRTAQEAKVTDKIVLQHGDITRLAKLLDTASFDVILCHNVLEYLDDPIAVLSGAAHALRDSSAILSVLVRNRVGEVFKAAIQAGDLAVAENNLTAEWGQESLYGGRVRLFTSDSLQAMLKAESLAVIAERGVRVLADYLPSRISRSAQYERILELERKLSVRPEYAVVARYTQCFARLP